MPKYSTSILALFVSLAALSAAPAIAADGPIVITQAKANAGNVTPGDAPGFPVTLSLPGSYILAGNLHPPANKTAIRIASDDITIDMNGFRLQGVGGAAFGINGGAFEGVTIRNGTITGFNASGISGEGENWIVENMRVVGNGADGIYLGGNFSSVRDSVVTDNGNIGIVCTRGCLVAESAASANGESGIYIDSGTVLGNVIIDNADYGINGTAAVGYGNNTLAGNNNNGPQVAGIALHPNLCVPACP